MERKTLNQVLPRWKVNKGIFHYLDSFNVPWKSLDISLELDLDYHGNHSGGKYISPLINNILMGETLIDNEASIIAGVIYKKFGEKWDKLWATLNLEYNPIENYNMTETGEDSSEYEHGKTDTQTTNLTHGKTGTETDTPNTTIQRTDNLTETGTPNITQSEDNEVSGFNSANPVPTDSRTITQIGTSTRQNSGTQSVTESGTKQTTYNTTDTDSGTVTNVQSGTDMDMKTHSLVRKGNIGVMTTQQMIKQEREVASWNVFEDTVYKDVDSVLVLNVF